MPELRSTLLTPTLLMAAETGSVLGVLRDTFSAREIGTTRDRSGRILEGRTESYRYYMVAMSTSPDDSEGSGPDPAQAVAELAWYTGRLAPVNAILLVCSGENLVLADRLIPRCATTDGGEPEFLPDLIRAVPADLPVGTVVNGAMFAAARWLAIRFGPHQVWSITVPGAAPPERNDRSRYHRSLRTLTSALVEQAR